MGCGSSGRQVELHGAQGEAQLHPGDVVFIPPDAEHGLRTPNGGRWLAIWPNKERLPGKRYAKQELDEAVKR